MAAKFTEFCKRIGVKLTDGQTIVARVVFDGDEPEDVPGAEAFFGPVKTVPPLARRIIVVVCGARAGKTYVLLGLRLLHLALTVPLRIAPGEEAVAPFVAPTLKLSKQGFRYARGAAKANPKIKQLLSNVSSESMTITRPDGHTVRLECVAATRGGQALRGTTYVGTAMDEAAFFRDEDSGVVNDQELLNAARPRVVPEGQLVIASTPYLSSGVLYKYWSEEFGNPKRALVVHAPTRLMNPDPFILQQIEEEYEQDPENAEREFGAKFLAMGSSTFFDHVKIAASTDETLVLGRAATEGAKLCAAGDEAFRSDCATLVVTEEVDGVISVLAIDEQKPSRGAPLVPSKVVAHQAEILKRYGIERIVVDQFYIESVREEFDKHGIEVIEAPSGQPGKATVYMATKKRLNESQLRLPKHPRMLADMRLVVSKPTSGGGLTITSPRRATGGHGDIASALTLAVWAMPDVYSEATPPPPAPLPDTEAWILAERDRNRQRVLDEQSDNGWF